MSKLLVLHHGFEIASHVYNSDSLVKILFSWGGCVCNAQNNVISNLLILWWPTKSCLNSGPQQCNCFKKGQFMDIENMILCVIWYCDRYSYKEVITPQQCPTWKTTYMWKCCIVPKIVCRIFTKTRFYHFPIYALLL